MLLIWWITATAAAGLASALLLATGVIGAFQPWIATDDPVAGLLFSRLTGWRSGCGG